jgi:hypothetical protein
VTESKRDEDIDKCDNDVGGKGEYNDSIIYLNMKILVINRNLYIHKYLNICIHEYLYINFCIYAFEYVCIYIYTYIYRYIYV